MPNPIAKFNKATLAQPGYAPEFMTGALPHAFVMSGLGILGGRYLFPSIANWINPNIRKDRARLVGTIGGGLAGLALASPKLWSGWHGGGAKGLVNHQRNWSTQRERDLAAAQRVQAATKERQQAAEAQRQRMDERIQNPSNPAERRAKQLRQGQEQRGQGAQHRDKIVQGSERMTKLAFWNQPSIDVSQARANLGSAVFSGAMRPMDAVRMDAAMRNAQKPQLTPAEAVGQFAGSAVSAGMKFLPAYAAGRIAGAVLGGMTSYPPETQRTISQGTGILAGVANTLWPR